MTSDRLHEFLMGIFRTYLDRNDQRHSLQLTPVSTNTQARRLDVVLGYLDAIGEMATEESISRKFRQMNLDSSVATSAESTESGRMTNSPSFTKHYLAFLLSFNLVLKQGQGVVPTGLGRLLRNCRTYSSPYPPFQKVARRLVAYIHFINDPLTTNICVAKLAKDPQTIGALAEVFHSEAVSILSRIIDDKESKASWRSARSSKQKLLSWKNPRTYAEHLVSAKLHMLSDCGIVHRTAKGVFSLMRPLEQYDPAKNVTDFPLNLDTLMRLFEPSQGSPDPIAHLIWLRSAFSNRPQSVVPMSIVVASFVGFGIVARDYSDDVIRTTLSYNNDGVSLRCHLGGSRGQSYLSILPK